MFSKLPLKIIVFAYGVLLVLWRLFNYRIEMSLRGGGIDFLYISFFVLSIILIVLTIIKAFKKEFKPILIFVFVIAAVVFIPFEFLIGFAKFELTRPYRKTIVTQLQARFYGDILQKNKFPDEGTWVENVHPKFKIFKDRPLQMVFIPMDGIGGGFDFYGELYISNNSQLRNRKVYDFLGREFDAKHLGGNWYWVDCYEDITPAP